MSFGAQATHAESRSRSPRASLESYAQNIAPAEDKSEEVAQREAMASLPLSIQNRLKAFTADEDKDPNATFDPQSLVMFKALGDDLRENVLTYLEAQQVFIMASRSKSGSLITACHRAKQGSLDVRGVGLADPWRAVLLAQATPRRPQIDLIPEAQWLQHLGDEPLCIFVDASVDARLAGSLPLRLSMRADRTIGEVKDRLALVGVSVPPSRIALRNPHLGFLRNDRSLAYYNMMSGAFLQLVVKKRGGAAHRKDHSV